MISLVQNPALTRCYMIVQGIALLLAIAFNQSFLSILALSLWAFYVLAVGLRFHLRDRIVDYLHWLYLAVQVHAIVTFIVNDKDPMFLLVYTIATLTFIFLPHHDDPKPPRRRKPNRAGAKLRWMPAVATAK